MPSTINGIGTTYYGKKNVKTYRGVCESCNREGMLQDYETGYFFCFVFLPIIPLGKKQILAYCPNCTRHRSVPLAEWHRIREDSINQGMEELAANKDDPQAAVKLLGTLTAFNQQEQALELAAATKSRYRDNVDIQISLGSWYEQTGRVQDANRCFDLAYQVDPNHPGAIRAHAVGKLEQGNLDEARKLLSQFIPPSPHFDPSLFFVLACAYQEQNRHKEAMQLFELVKESSPDMANQKAFRKAVKKSEKHVR